MQDGGLRLEHQFEQFGDLWIQLCDGSGKLSSCSCDDQHLLAVLSFSRDGVPRVASGFEDSSKFPIWATSSCSDSFVDCELVRPQSRGAGFQSERAGKGDC